MQFVGRVFANSPGDLGSIPGRVIPKTFKMVLDTSLLNTHQCKVSIKGKVEQSRERCSSYWKGNLWSPTTIVSTLLYFTLLNVLQLRIRVDLGIMEIKLYTFFKLQDRKLTIRHCLASYLGLGKIVFDCGIISTKLLRNVKIYIYIYIYILFLFLFLYLFY